MAYTKTPSFFPLYWRGIEFALHMTVFFLFLLQKAYTCPSSVQRNPCSYTFLILCLSILWWSFTLIDFSAQRNQKEGPEVEKRDLCTFTPKKPVSIFSVPVFFFCVVTVLGNGWVHGVFIRETGGLQTNPRSGGILCFCTVPCQRRDIGEVLFLYSCHLLTNNFSFVSNEAASWMDGGTG